MGSVLGSIHLVSSGCWGLNGGVKSMVNSGGEGGW